MFYSSYDDQFSQAVLSSYTANILGKSEMEQPNAPCYGSDTLYSEILTCNDVAYNQSRCTFQKTYSLSNGGSKPTLVFLAIGGCGMLGIVDWEVAVNNYGTDIAGVCGARGTLFGKRCLSDSSGTCTLQEPSQIFTSMQPPQKLSKAAETVIAALFVVVFAIVAVAVKYYQARRKHQRAKALLSRVGLPAVRGLDPTMEGGRPLAADGSSPFLFLPPLFDPSQCVPADQPEYRRAEPAAKAFPRRLGGIAQWVASLNPMPIPDDWT